MPEMQPCRLERLRSGARPQLLGVQRIVNPSGLSRCESLPEVVENIEIIEQFMLLKILQKHGTTVDDLPGGWNPLIASVHNGRLWACEYGRTSVVAYLRVSSFLA
jgi:hypothetical protein